MRGKNTRVRNRRKGGWGCSNSRSFSFLDRQDFSSHLSEVVETTLTGGTSRRMPVFLPWQSRLVCTLSPIDGLMQICSSCCEGAFSCWGTLSRLGCFRYSSALFYCMIILFFPCACCSTTHIVQLLFSTSFDGFTCGRGGRYFISGPFATTTHHTVN